MTKTPSKAASPSAPSYPSPLNAALLRMGRASFTIPDAPASQKLSLAATLNALAKDHPERFAQMVIAGGFAFALGLFHVASSRLDAVTDFAICKFSKLSPEETHLIMAGMMFGRKGRLLADLIGRSDHPRKAALLGAFNQLRGNNKREILVHGIIYSADGKELELSFIDRSISGEYRATLHKFSLAELMNYIHNFFLKGHEFEKELGVSQDELSAFAAASLSLNRKPKTSPTTPSASAESFSAHQS